MLKLTKSTDLTNTDLMYIAHHATTSPIPNDPQLANAAIYSNLLQCIAMGAVLEDKTFNLFTKEHTDIFVDHLLSQLEEYVNTNGHPRTPTS